MAAGVARSRYDIRPGGLRLAPPEDDTAFRVEPVPEMQTLADLREALRVALLRLPDSSGWTPTVARWAAWLDRALDAPPPRPPDER